LWNEQIGLEDESATTVSPVHQAEKIKVPMLIVQVQDDARVARVQGRLMRDKLESLDKEHTYVEIEFGGHSLKNEPGRQQVLKALDEFLGENIGTK
jgi:dipeptidyl aminopeptidase/acylaminoacyl peptidase